MSDLAETPMPSFPNSSSGGSPAGSPAAAPAGPSPSVAGPVRPPRALLFDSAVAILVVAVCAWQRHRFLDLTDNWLLALSLFFPVGNLLGLGLSLRAYKLGQTALHYRMALGAVFTLYYGYVALHLLGLSESPLGTLLVTAAGATPTAKIGAGIAVAVLLGQTFIATDACQQTLAALHPAPALPASNPAPAPAAAQPA